MRKAAPKNRGEDPARSARVGVRRWPMLRTFALGFVLSLTGPLPEAFAERAWARFQQDRAYDACMAHAGQDDWTCEGIYEGWPVIRPQGQAR